MMAAAAKQFKYVTFVRTDLLGTPGFPTVDTTHGYNPPYGTGDTSPRANPQRFQGYLYKELDKWDINNPIHRRILALRDPHVNRAIYQVAQKLFNSNIRFYADRDRMKRLQPLEEKFIEKGGHLLFRQFARLVWTQGHAIMMETKQGIRSYSAPWLEVVVKEGVVEKYQLYTMVKGIRATKPSVETIKPDDCIHHELDDDEYDGKGTSKLAAAWDSVLFKTMMMVSMAEFDARLGSGIIVYKVPITIGDKELAKIETDLANYTSRNWMVAKVSAIPGQASTFGVEAVTPEQVDYATHIEAVKSDVACGLGYPKRFLEGDPEGALASASVDALSVKDKMESEFDGFVPDILDFIKRWIGPKTLPKLIDPHIELGMSDKDRAEVRMKDATSASLEMKFQALAEVRERAGLPPEPPGGQTGAQVTAPAPVPGEKEPGGSKGPAAANPAAGPNPPHQGDAVMWDKSEKARFKVTDKGDSWELAGTITRAGIYDYGYMKIHRDAATVKSAIDHYHIDDLPIRVGMYHEDQHEVLARNSIGHAVDLKIGEDDTVDCKFILKKARVDAWFANPEKAHPVNWLRRAIESGDLIPVSVGSTGHIDDTDEEGTYYQDWWEIRSVAIVDQGRCSTPYCGMKQTKAEK